MQTRINLWRLFFALGIIAIVAQQIKDGALRPVIIQPLNAPLFNSILFIGVNLLMALASVGIIFNVKARPGAVYLGATFLALLIISHLPNQLNNSWYFLGGWGDAFKILALSGGAFIIAESLPADSIIVNPIQSFFEQLIPAGRFFFAITMVVFGIEHFVYTPFVAMLVPAWVPSHVFWAYFAGVALIAAGLAVILNVKLKLAANLLGLMIFLWLILLHIPRAIADPISGNGNEWTSVFEALAFSGIALTLGQSKNIDKAA